MGASNNSFSTTQVKKLACHNNRRPVWANKFLVAIMAISFLFPTISSAFSLGQIRVTGAFSKQFRAEIPVRVDGKPGLEVWLGSKSDYKKLGLKIPSFINKFAITVADHPTAPGQKIIYIVGSEPVYQPSFNLVVKASLGGGVILENYFLAVDFQKNLAIDLPAGDDDATSEIARLAEELQAIKQSEMVKETPLDRIRHEEAEAMAGEQADEPTIEKVTEELPEEPEPEQPVIEPPVKRVVAPTTYIKVEKLAVPKVTAPTTYIEIEKAQVKRVVAPTTYINTQPVKPTASPRGLITISPDPADNIRRVRAGNSLYRIARSLGAKRADYNRVVVALWKTNISAFIKGNMHGLRADATIDYNKVNGVAKSMTNEEAKRLIDEQWPLWQKHVKNAMASKKRSKPAKNKTAGIVIESQTLTALATQNKKPTIAKKEKKVADTLKQKDEEQPGLSYVAHVASYKNRESALKLVRFLRKKGLNAFEASSSAPKQGSWSRVLVNRYANLSLATSAVDKMRADGVSQYIRVLILPYAIQVDEPSDAKTAEGKIARLANLGISAYTVADGEGNVTLFTGAFSSEKAAQEAIKGLSSHGLPLTVVIP